MRDDGGHDETMRDLATQATAVPQASATDATLAAPGGASQAAPSSTIDRYQLGPLLGRGGMGEVLSARDEQLGRAVAVKRMRTGASPEATRRFLREAQIQARLDHPAIVPVYELGRDRGGEPVIVMKQLAGVTLADVIELLAVEDPEARVRYPRQRLLRAFADVCLAVELAHTKGIVHRDLKPANIMLGEFGEVYVLDWGIARVVGEPDREVFGDLSNPERSGTQLGALLGTPGYMAPEQVRGEADLDGRTDVYALGCILFELLALEPRHPRGQLGLSSALAGDVVAPSQRAPTRDIAPELDAACLAATAVERSARVGSARALGELVQRYLDGDRDLALRQELARRELAAAHATLDGGLLQSLSESRQARREARPDAIAAYAEAMRAAARALALDPQAPEPAELVGRLMLEPPVDVPPEVEATLAATEDRQIAGHARLGTFGLLGYLVFFPVMYLGGIRDAWLVVGGSILTLAIMAVVYAVSRRPLRPLVYASFAGQLVLVVLYARGMTPLLIAPGVALITLMIYASHPRIGNGWALYACCAAAVLAPLGLEATGALSATTSVEGAMLVLRLPADRLDPTVAMLGLGAYVAVILAIATLLTRLQALQQRRAQRELQLQAWQLRQLLPARTPARA